MRRVPCRSVLSTESLRFVRSFAFGLSLCGAIWGGLPSSVGSTVSAAAIQEPEAPEEHGHAPDDGEEGARTRTADITPQELEAALQQGPGAAGIQEGPAPPPDSPLPPLDETERHDGELVIDDTVDANGAAFDSYEFEVTDRNRRAIVTLNSQAFDTVLVVSKLTDDGEPDPRQSWRNDDYGQGSDSRLDLTFVENGRYRVDVYGYDPTEMGRYQLSIRRMTAPIPPMPQILRTEMGAITAEDPVSVHTGNPSDTFPLEIAPGPGRVAVDVWSDDFDTFVAVEMLGPDGNPTAGQLWMNDDFGSSQRHSHVEFDVVEGGKFRIIVSPYAVGAGNYEVQATFVERTASEIAASDILAVGHAGPNVVPGGAALGPLDERLEVGILNRFDPQNARGQHFDRYEIRGFAGQPIRIVLRSSEFDTFLQLNALDENDDADPSRQWTNDDSAENVGASELSMVLPHDGTYRITVLPLVPGALGRYEMTIAQGGMGGGVAAPAGLPVGPNDRLEVGNLGPQDPKTDDGRSYDEFAFQAEAGATFTVEVTSLEFDPVLEVRSDQDEFYIESNDDYEDSRQRSLVVLTVPEAGTYRARVRSYDLGASGTYRMVIRSGDARTAQGAGEAVEAAAPLEPPRAAPAQQIEETGALGEGDTTLDTGEFYDEYVVTGQPGQRIRIDLNGPDFDTYLMLVAPSGRKIEADDFQGNSNRTVIEAVLNETGDHQVVVTSFEPEEAGDYTLAIELTGAGGVDEQGRLVSGSRFPVDLSDRSPVDEQGKRYQDYRFEAKEGDRVVLSMTSDLFDTMIVVTFPDGSVETIDDWQGSNAGIDRVLEQAGEYVVRATTFEGGVTGRYELSFELRDKDTPSNKGRRLLGVFVGIADYEGADGDLERCDVDAERLYSMMRDDYGMAIEDGILLVNGDATREAVRGALKRIGERATADDLLIVFYSGHGGQFEGPIQPSDPDGVHETMSLYDGDLVDDQVAELLNASPAGLVLLVMDSCYSGGFAKDVVSAPGRMGIFACEEDVLAQVAENFEAGGYLSRFLADAFLDRRDKADRNEDRALSAWELCHYLGERYRDEVRSFDEDEVLEGEGESTDGDEAEASDLIRDLGKRPSRSTESRKSTEEIDPGEDLSFQRLVVDRGGVKTDTVLLAW